MKKYFSGILIPILFIGLTACSNSSDKARIAYLEQQIEELQSNQNTVAENKSDYQITEQDYQSPSNTVSTNSTAGTYEVTDKVNHTWIITLNDDGTVRTTCKGLDTTFYALWEDESIWGGFTTIKYSDKSPNIVFPSWKEGTYGSSNEIQDGYLYYSQDDMRAKNPENRLQIKKFK